MAAQDLQFTWPEALKGFLENVQTIPHAFLFLGQESAAQETVKHFAEKITGQAFPNVDTVQFDAAGEARLDVLREVLHLAALRPVSAAKKIVVLANMQESNPQMQNALLKTLEEPSSSAVFVLLSNQPLLPTIMSRCQVILMPRSIAAPPPSEIAEGLQMLQQHRGSGLAERLALVSALADLDDAVLPKLIEQWLHQQTAELKNRPQNFPAVRNSMETLQALKGNFNKKMVLQNFVTVSLA